MKTNEVSFNLDVLCSFMKNRIASNVQRTLVVTIEQSRSELIDAEIMEEIMNPNNLTRSHRQCTIFKLAARASNNV